MNAHLISLSEARDRNIYITGKKEHLYSKCVNCLHSYYAVALGLNPKYGWYVQCCQLDKCVPLYSSYQLSLDF